MELEFELIEKIKPRPALFLGNLSISKLKSFLDGYQTAIYDFNISNFKTIQPLPFWFFHEYVARRYGFFESSSGWLNMILEQVVSEEEGLSLFFELFNDFKHLKFVSLFSCVINHEHLDFHHKDKYSPKRLTGDEYDIEKPLYQKLQKIYYAKLANNIGYIGFFETEKEYELIPKIYKTRENIIDYWQCCFGSSLDWKNQNYDNINLYGKHIV